MAGAKETPRQKMISMMYLVLTALLALNVSVEVIDSFNNVNKGIETSISSIERKLDDSELFQPLLFSPLRLYTDVTTKI